MGDCLLVYGYVSINWWLIGELTITGLPRAIGKHIQAFGPNVVEDMFIGLFSSELTYTGVIVFVKFSILALYWRIFSKTNIKLPISILATFVFMWGTAVVSIFGILISTAY